MISVAVEEITIGYSTVMSSQTPTKVSNMALQNKGAEYEIYGSSPVNKNMLLVQLVPY